MNELHPILTIPLQMGADSVIRVGQTRVTLDTVIGAFKGGSTAEEIIFQYPVLELADVYAVVSYYLNNQPAVESYLQAVPEVSEQLRWNIQQKFPITDLRQRLMVRLTVPFKSDN
jgi:uncharacterized protein (DUF433 family)